MAWFTQRLIAGIELAVYGPLSLVSGWFDDDPGYCGRDLLADPQCTPEDRRLAQRMLTPDTVQ